MMAAPMSFLERLAPGVDQGGGVRPALPARFAPVQFEALLSEEVTPDLGGDPAPALRDRRAAEVERRFEQSAALAAPLYSRPMQPVRGLQPASMSSAPLPQTESTSAMHPTLRAAPIASPSPVISTSIGDDEPTAIVSRTPAPRSVAPESANAGAPVVSPAQSPLVRVNTPLREPLVRQHEPSAMSVAPTEIHITIDRIDVRAPAIPPSASPRSVAAKPRAATSLSLGDYLRQSRPGGAR